MCAILGQSTFARLWVQTDTLSHRMKAHMAAMPNAEHSASTSGSPHQACGSLPALVDHQLQVLLQLQPQLDLVTLAILFIVQEKPLTIVQEINVARMVPHVLLQIIPSQVAQKRRLSIAQELLSIKLWFS